MLSRKFPALSSILMSAIGAFLLTATSTANAALIASDSFLVGGTNQYTAGSIAGQNPTAGLSGFTGAWSTGTTNIQAFAGGLNHALVINPPGPTNAGSLGPTATGGASPRSLTRAISSVPVSTDYWFSGVLMGNGVGGLRMGLAGATGSMAAPAIGVQVGMEDATDDADALRDDIVFYYNNTSNVYTQATLLQNYTNGESYFFTAHLTIDNAGADAIVINLYNGLATDINTPTATVTVAGNIIPTTDLIRLNMTKTTDSGAATPLRADEFRFGTTLDDVALVTIVPEPASVGLLGLGAMLLIRRRRA